MLDTPTGDPEFVAIGWTTGVHGMTGEIRVKVYTDVPERFDAGQSV